MARTFGGHVFYAADEITIPAANNGAAAGNYALTLDDANGFIEWVNAAGVATVSFFRCADPLKRPHFNFPAEPGDGTVPLSNEYQEAFGTAAGGPGNPFSGIPSGNPVLAGSQFGTANVPWGFALVDVYAVYSVQTANLTAATISVNRLRFSENAAIGVDNILAPTAVALTQTTSGVTPHVQKVTLAQPIVFESADFSALEIRFTITTAATSAVKVFGIGLHGAVEYS